MGFKARVWVRVQVRVRCFVATLVLGDKAGSLFPHTHIQGRATQPAFQWGWERPDVGADEVRGRVRVRVRVRPEEEADKVSSSSTRLLLGASVLVTVSFTAVQATASNVNVTFS